MAFKNGDAVQMTAETLKVNSRALSTTGIVVRDVPNHFGEIKIRRDRLRTIESWHPSAWELKVDRNGR